MNSPFAPPELPSEPPYNAPHHTPHDTTGASVWPVPESGTPNRSSVVMDHAVLPHRGPGRRKAWLLGVILALLATGGAFALSLAGDRRGTPTSTAGSPATPAGTATPSSLVPAAAPDGTSGLDVVRIVAKIRSTVVKVAVEISSGGGGGEGVGTGVILTRDGEILTNAHVVVDASKVRVVLDGTSDPVDAKVLGIDVGNDLALLKVDGKDLPVMQLADSDTVKVGQPVVAIGYALDLEGDPSVTAGIISALGRSMVTNNGALDGLLQTDAAISSGNSGGPLVDGAGSMIGINTAVARSDSSNAANNIGFAISTREIEKIIDRLKTSGSTDKRIEGYLGIGVDDRHDGGRGAIVSEVQDGSPAAKLGLHVGDVVTDVNGVEINGQAGLIAAIRDSAPGDTVTVHYSRDGQAMSGTAKLVARPAK